MFTRKPPRDYTQGEFEGWVDAAERAVAQRYGFRPETPLRDNAMFLFLVHRAAHGRISNGGAEMLVTRAMAAFFACTGLGCGDMLYRHLRHDYFDQIHLSQASSADLADGLLGYLLVPARPTRPLFRSKTYLAINIFFAALAAIWIHALILVPVSILGWDSALPLVCGALAPVGIAWLVWRLLVEPGVTKRMVDTERWIAAITPLSTPAERRRFWSRRGVRGGGLRSYATLAPLNCFRPWWSRAGALEILRTAATRLLFFFLAHSAASWVWDWPSWRYLSPVVGYAWGLLVLFAIWFPLSLFEERRFNRVAKLDELLVEGVDAWRVATLDRHEARETA